MCLVWAAFCTNSALTLSDGLRLAKTGRRPSEVLAILTGRSEVGATASCAFKAASAKAAGGLDEHDRASTQAPSSAPASPSQAPSVEAPSRAGTAYQLSWEACPGGPSRCHSLFGEAKLFQSVVLPLPAASMPGEPVLPEQRLAPRCRRPDLVDPRDTDLAHFRRCAKVEFLPWARGAFAIAGPGQRLAKCVHGEVRYFESPGCGASASAVAKVVPMEAVERSRTRERNERRAWLTEGEAPSLEDPLNEIAVLAHLQRCGHDSPFVIRFLGAFQDETSSYLLTEYCEGGELFERVACGVPLSEAMKKRYISQILEAVRYLHGRNVGHRDISLENVLLKNENCVLIDFGQAVRLRNLEGTPLRYFAEAGKRLYRAPEMYVPRQRVVQVVCPSDAVPGSVAQVSYDKCRCEVLLPADASPGRACAAEPHGYAAAPVDVFACGVCAFVLVVGKPPWAVARDVDPTFSFIRRHGVPMLLKQWRGGAAAAAIAPSDEEAIIAQLLRTEPAKRPRIDEACALCRREDQDLRH